MIELEDKVSTAQLEVWRWKEEAGKEVAHLDVRTAIRKRLADSEATARRLGFPVRAEPRDFCE